MINQIIFNQLINPNVGGLYYKLLLKTRSILLVLNPNATIQYSYNNIVLTFPFSHDYALNRKEVPLYSENLGVVSKIILSKYKDARAIDVGANIGDSAAIINHYSKMPVLCIEGNPKFIPMLEKNSKQMKNIAIEPCFVGEINETVSTINYGGTARIETAETGIEVKTVTQILNKHEAFNEAKLLKIDTDGFDFKILRASEQFLINAKPILFFEFDPFFLIKQNENPASIFPFLNKLNYSNLLLFDNHGNLLCEVKSNQTELIQDLIHYYNKNGEAYLDICALHDEDFDLVLKIKQEFQK